MTDPVVADELQRLFFAPTFRVYTNPDVVGCETAGALKNVLAIGAGIADGLGYGDNTKAALITRGLAELARLGVAMGGQPLTFAGLAGMGDLIATCASPQSRNRHVGVEIGRGRPLDEVVSEMNMVAEGVKTTAAVIELAARHEVEMPLVRVRRPRALRRRPPRGADPRADDAQGEARAARHAMKASAVWLGALGFGALATVDEHGAIAAGDFGLDWLVGADDRWHVPATEPATYQQRPGPAPVFETVVRVPGGEVAHSAYAATVGADAGVIVEVENRSPAPLTIGLVVRVARRARSHSTPRHCVSTAGPCWWPRARRGRGPRARSRPRS